jgi:hypothetical protein
LTLHKQSSNGKREKTKIVVIHQATREPNDTKHSSFCKIRMPRKKGNKQAKQFNETLATPVIIAKCTGCQVNGELKACAFCQYPECAACIEKHRQADKLSQAKAIFETKIDYLRQQTGESNYYITTLNNQRHFILY